LALAPALADAEGLTITLRYMRDQPIEWTVERSGRGRG
jgi:hypothetical protein